MLGLASPPVRHPKRLPKERPKDYSGSISASTIYKPKKAAFRRRTIPMRSRIAEKGSKKATENHGSGRKILHRAGGGGGLLFSNFEPPH
jgi:hypothetical protein